MFKTLTKTVYAATGDGEGVINFTQLSNEVGVKDKFADIGSIISTLIPYIFYGAGIILFLMIIAGGIELMTSGGDPKKVQLARDRITNAVIGFIIIFVAYWITQIIYKILGVEPRYNLF